MTEDEVVDALKRLAQRNIFAAPTSATAALDKLLKRRAIRETDITVVIITGNGMKAAATVASAVGDDGGL
ncbi:hypothetical protein [Sphingobium sp.]|uniref:hypothetical protein n=1 Tax=Sphingobium sp. TaxID=1912891 RepID=UPI002CC9C40B|nr:hypothetical protein [Sphingobium sp.]HUD90449.1 hypothetical protein [Sphingobium sp.]